ncbi:unnamed protein product [Spirodela intermedia]|uniref:allantoate deiminase n=1 Tax=Spirodela intermedia TaxID=51605 RepID=A0A7I8JI84_SPIIN|nr:unnamed protein product [Spirodela intermedia]CAA6669856.1 unnamed protein product [Spirodela intermedia]
MAAAHLLRASSSRASVLFVIVAVFAGFSEGRERERRALRGDLRDEAVARLYELGKVTDADGHLERTFLSPAFTRASKQVLDWMKDAGLKTFMVDQMGNVHGRVDGRNASAEALLIGSHIDTVIDAGFYDGTLGVISAIAAVKALMKKGRLNDLKRPVEVIAFSDEEGVRFQSTFLGSSAVAGILPAKAFEISDKSGATLRDVLKANSLEATEESLIQLKYDPSSVWGYVEVHIEQGPVLEFLGYPLGVVKGIAGQTRLKVTVGGSQGHAGTIPMAMRQDPMAASAELILFLETLCKSPAKFLNRREQCRSLSGDSIDGLVCTVGDISIWPGASNVIPGQVTFSVDLRAIDDEAREAVIFEFSEQLYEICDRRSVLCTVEQKHSAGAVRCDPALSSHLEWAARTAAREISGGFTQTQAPVMMSGAGHDAMAMSHLTKVGMLFVRCRGGVSHSPEEYVLEEDVWAAGLAIMNFLESL